MSDLALLITAAATLLTCLGGGGTWVVSHILNQSKRFDRMEERYNGLHREHTLVLVKMERFRLAFQIVAAELVSSNPKSSALVHARALLAENFVFPSDGQMQTPPDMAHALDEINEKAPC